MATVRGRVERLMSICNSEYAREKMWARIHLIPVLQAEADRDMVRRTLADKAREKELMGGEVQPYFSDRYEFDSPAAKRNKLILFQDLFDLRSQLRQIQ